MNTKIYRTILAITALFMLNTCKKPFLPEVVASNSNYLVVEGVINPGQDSTIIRLSRTVKLSDSVSSNPELHATVTVESDANTSYQLTESKNGYYAAAGPNLSSSNKYRVKIVTADSKVYQSDLVPVKNAPPIDSVHYQIKNDGVQINVDTHDPSNNTRYYRWEYNETWIIHSRYSSISVVTHVPKDSVVNRPLADQIYTCWANSASSAIILNSTAKLSGDIVKDSPVTFIASSSERVKTRYSILVKQYAVTKEAYNYFTQLKKNTEQLGSIFDAQPSEIMGNIHCLTNPAEPVIGYITAGTFSQSRIYINNRDLPAWQTELPFADCKMDTLYYVNPKTGLNDVKTYILNGGQIPIYPIQPPRLPIIGFAASDPQCVDCTLRGTNKQPDFWTNQ